MWKSECFLADYLINNISKFCFQSNIELGAGYHGLASLCLAKYNAGGKYVVTDGNMVCVECKHLTSYNKQYQNKWNGE